MRFCDYYEAVTYFYISRTCLSFIWEVSAIEITYSTVLQAELSPIETGSDKIQIDKKGCSLIFLFFEFITEKYLDQTGAQKFSQMQLGGRGS